MIQRINSKFTWRYVILTILQISSLVIKAIQGHWDHFCMLLRVHYVRFLFSLSWTLMRVIQVGPYLFDMKILLGWVSVLTELDFNTIEIFN